MSTNGTPARGLSRQLTADGRNSLRSYLFGPRQRPQFQHWFKRILKPEIYPLLVLVPSVVLAGAYFGIRELRLNPAVQVNKMERKQSIRHNEGKANRWIKNHEKIAHAVPIVRHEK
uniref:Uncharacterized protein n=1 Tax=Aplanochytrium stocchinoi TaxID=215587 RepID=A0A6S8BY56_9STRA|mmetsp:Transcript_12811/g.15913  ORF Transcript_12811/g.15913 Transcript_12811/m.15913 type:complete len:116 (+) Transcript_12811:253-600(+)